MAPFAEQITYQTTTVICQVTKKPAVHNCMKKKHKHLLAQGFLLEIEQLCEKWTILLVKLLPVPIVIPYAADIWYGLATKLSQKKKTNR